MTKPIEIPNTLPTADALRRLALNEEAKAYVMADPKLSGIARKMAKKYVAGETRAEAIEAAKRVNELGYTATIDFMGESVRDETEANEATTEFLELATGIKEAGLNCSISLDVSHIGSIISYDFGLANAHKLAVVTKEAGIDMMISMEGSDRTDDILRIHKALSDEFDHVGITIQARPHRTAEDLPKLLERSGRIRLVKGAYDMSPDIAYPRDSEELHKAYDNYVKLLLESGHLCSIATHDWERIVNAKKVIENQGISKDKYTFEVLSGLGTEQAQQTKQEGYPVQEYVVYGAEWWLYVCNRIAEKPVRLFDAVADASN